MVALRLVILSILLTLKTPAYACGWGGDGEMSQSDDDIIAADGRPVEQSLDLKSMKLPGKMGYGIAVPGLGDTLSVSDLRSTDHAHKRI